LILRESYEILIYDNNSFLKGALLDTLGTNLLLHGKVNHNKGLLFESLYYYEIAQKHFSRNKK